MAKSARVAGRQGHGGGQTEARAEHRQRREKLSVLAQELGRIEAIERDILTSLGHSPDDLGAAINSISKNDQIKPDSKSQRAWFSILSLRHLAQLKADIWNDDMARAVTAALRVGAYGGTALADAFAGNQVKRKGGTARANQRRAQHARWQAIVDKAERAPTTKTQAAYLVHRALSKDRVSDTDLPPIDTITRRISITKKHRK